MRHQDNVNVGQPLVQAGSNELQDKQTKCIKNEIVGPQEMNWAFVFDAGSLML